MGKYDALLEYQALDGEISKIESEISNHAFNKERQKVYNAFQKAQASLDANQLESDGIIAEIDLIKEEVKKCVSRIDEISKEISGMDDDRKIALYADLDRMNQRLVNADKKLAKSGERLKQIVANVRQLLHEKIKYKGDFDKINETFLAYKNKRMIEIKKIADKKKEIEPKIDTAAKDIYMAHKKDVVPLFVEAVVSANGEEASCLCGMKLSKTAFDNLKKKTYCQCESCRRYAIINK